MDSADAEGTAVRVLAGTLAYNTHVQHMVRALYEQGALYEYVSGGVDSFRHPMSRAARACLATSLPRVSRQLARRAVPNVPAGFVRSRWRWEAPRIAASHVRAAKLEDWLWERGEMALDAHCARLLRRQGIEAFLGVEHGALASLTVAKQLGKIGIVAFLSPHHRTRLRWLDAEYARFPELEEARHVGIDALTPDRDGRRDAEAAVSSWIVSNSSFTTMSLADAGFAPEKILTVPLGGPEPMDERELTRSMVRPVTFVFVGPVSVRKGAHYLLRAWRRVAGPGMTLHFYGKVLLPDSVIREATGAPGGDAIVFHGSVPGADLPGVYRSASVLVLPTLCDGFGLVVSEALANGLPVITTRNAGAADAIDHGRSGFVIPPADEDALASSLAWCAGHPHDLLAMRREALIAASRWTWADFRARFRQLLEIPLSAVGHVTPAEGGVTRAAS